MFHTFQAKSMILSKSGSPENYDKWKMISESDKNYVKKHEGNSCNTENRSHLNEKWHT